MTWEKKRSGASPKTPNHRECVCEGGRLEPVQKLREQEGHWKAVFPGQSCFPDEAGVWGPIWQFGFITN